MPKLLPTPTQLRELLRYEPETGKLYWRTAPLEYFSATTYSAERKCAAWNGKYAGREALFHRDAPDLYAYGDVFGVKVYAHRAILAMISGEWPTGDVDHINRDKTDNRLENIRAVSRRVNAMNRPIASHNKSGAMGIYWDRKRRKWAAEIFVAGVKRHIGRFDNFDEAKQARAREEAAAGFHPNHGRQPLTLQR